MRRQVLLAFLFGIVIGGVQAQTVDDAEKAFTDSVMKQRLVLRDYSADDTRTYRWVGEGLQSDPPVARTLGLFETSSVTWTPGKVEIRGERMTVVKNEKGFVSVGPSKVLLTVDIKGADPLAVAAKLKEQMFASTMADAVSRVPAAYRSDLPYAYARGEQKERSNAPSYMADFAMRTCGAGVVMTPPKVLHKVDPDYSDEARNQKYSGTVLMEITIDRNGHVVDPWVAAAVGLGLDEQAARAVAKWVFRPTMCDGVPKVSTLFIDVKFEVQ